MGSANDHRVSALTAGVESMCGAEQLTSWWLKNRTTGRRWDKMCAPSVPYGLLLTGWAAVSVSPPNSVLWEFTEG